MQDFSATIACTDDCESILEYVFGLLKAEGANWFTYNFTPIFESHTSPQSFIWARDCPIEYQRLYVGEQYRRRDPIPRLTFEHGPVLTWTQAKRLGASDRDAQWFFGVLKEMGVTNWLSVALFGPRNRDGYAAVQFSDDPDQFDPSRLSEIQSLLSTAHLQICKIMDEGKPTVSLSEREREVLRWMGHGKSSSDIAAILDISPETVRTYVRRIYDKLDTNDRVTATVRALKLGLVEL
ncbi:helix-turn-helix transcriptional regulator [Qipengyuania flava]|uniref:helix-turn-helix transcriptional regulator n=1 Tax=Qipengyuania flava TaxID=192812 RepID=UPI001C628601|nr:LuxR C-terminal-related transcriptional regulator [Qipengyuania flava]QYJ06000.1 LuxR family transcriptional regulator [Qipengyuania flava]